MIPQLRDYQNQGVDQIREAFKRAIKAVCYVLSTGAGKTICFAYIAWTSVMRGKKVLILVHRKELLKQTREKLQAFGIEPGMVSPDYRPNYTSQIQVAMVQTMVGRKHMYPWFDLIVTDECFVPGTMITMGDGTERPIQSIQAGDVVLAWDERTCEFSPKKVVRTFKNEKAGDLYRIYANGQKITCTGNHPILTDLGWLNADQINESHKILIYGVRNMRYSNGRTKKNVFRRVQAGGFIPNNESNQSDSRFAQDEGAEPDATQTRPAKDVGYPETNRTHAVGSRGQWQRNDRAAGDTFCCSCRLETDCRIRDSDANGQVFRVSRSLQNRHCDSGNKTGNRSRRRFSFRTIQAGSGQEKRGFSKWHRVASIKVLKPGSVREHLAMCGQNFVYNLEVADLHTYVANGIVVHNCHHVAASTYLQVIQAYPDAYQLGVTATPIRTDGKGLGRNSGGIYDYMVVGPQTAELIEMGYLVEPVIHVPPSLVDLTGVRKLGGEYSAKQATERVDKRSITGDAMDHYLSSAKYEPAVVFCASVAHAEHVAAEWRDMGIRAVAVDGTKRGKNKDWRTGDDDVDRALKGLADGSVHAVMSCDLISEGTDIPAISYMSDLGPTMSLGKHIQKIGRTLRPAPGKDRAIIMDHVGNVGKMENGMFIANHGLPTDIREWTLDGEMRSKRDKQEKLQSVAMCGSCYGVFIARLRVCPYCNTEREIKIKEIQQREGELVAITPEMKRREQIEKRVEVARAGSLDELEKLAKARGYKRGWAKAIFNAREAKKADSVTPGEPQVIQKQFNFGS